VANDDIQHLGITEYDVDRAVGKSTKAQRHCLYRFRPKSYVRKYCMDAKQASKVIAAEIKLIHPDEN
jgi:hypothetical protein